MNRAHIVNTIASSAALLGLLVPDASAQWVIFQNETSSRLSAAADLVVGDNLEKDFAWADFDGDGDVDLVVARKFPGSVEGGFPNMLLMNEGGVLTDRTALYASASDIEGDLGFLANTNDRDIKAADVDNDGWIDLITATTMSDSLNTVLGQPRIYRNLGKDAEGNWLGFRFEDARIPVLFAKNGSVANPRYCTVSVGDLTGDGYVDLFFTDYDTPETSGIVCIDLNQDGDVDDFQECNLSPAEQPSKDYDNKLLVNQGAANPGFFVDSGTTRMTAAQLASGFGNDAQIADMNGDGLLDVIRVNTLTPGQNVGIIYGKNAEGTSFDGPDTFTGYSPYAVEVADLNNDGKIDFLVADQGKDLFQINTGNGADGFANFTQYSITDSLFEFGNAVRTADLDNDGFEDVLIADVDADLPPFCPSTGRRMHIYRNMGGVPGGAMLREIGQVIPDASLGATFDVAPIDINGDGWLDLVIGRCAGIEVWMNVIPTTLSFSYPAGVPVDLVPDAATTFTVQASIQGGGSIEPGTAQLCTSVDDGPYACTPLTDLGGGLYEATLPAVACGSMVEFYVSGDLSNGPVFTDPVGAPGTGAFQAYSFDAGEVVLADSIEGSTAGWTVTSEAITGGAWVAIDPVGTANAGAIAQPEDAYDGTMCFITGNGLAGDAAGAFDVDGGPTRLLSPMLALDPRVVYEISYARWFYCDDAAAGAVGADSLYIDVSNDGGEIWTPVETVSTSASEWVIHTFFLNDLVAPTPTTQLRWSVADNPNNSITEAGVDAFVVRSLLCATVAPCPADFDGSGTIDGGDLGVLLGQWGASGTADLDGSGSVDGADLGLLLGEWGPCL